MQRRPSDSRAMKPQPQHAKGCALTTFGVSFNVKHVVSDSHGHHGHFIPGRSKRSRPALRPGDEAHPDCSKSGRLFATHETLQPLDVNYGAALQPSPDGLPRVTPGILGPLHRPLPNRSVKAWGWQVFNLIYCLCDISSVGSGQVGKSQPKSTTVACRQSQI